jgi:hypothetical protein
MLSPDDATEVVNGQHRLAALLAMIALVDQAEPVNYERRNLFVLEALLVARASGLAAGVRLDPAHPAWPVVFIELPDGQVSWHLPEHATPWDGHTNAQKYVRIATFVGRAYLGEQGTR